MTVFLASMWLVGFFGTLLLPTGLLWAMWNMGVCKMSSAKRAGFFPLYVLVVGVRLLAFLFG